MTTTTYFSFLIRIWHSGDPLVNCWHASLQDPTTQHITHFNTLEELFVFLRQIAGEEAGTEIIKI